MLRYRPFELSVALLQLLRSVAALGVELLRDQHMGE